MIRRRTSRDLVPRLVACVTVAAAVAGCGDDGPDARRDRVESVSSGGPAEIDRQAAIDAAVDVRADGCGPRVGFGTGAVVDEGVVVTAAHVVAGASSVEIVGTDGRSSAGTVVRFDPDLDFAVVRTASPIGAPLAARAAEAQGGESGIVVLPRVTAGEMTVDVVDVTVVRPANIRTTDIYLEDPTERPGFEIEATIDEGDSGAMVVLPGGGAGVVWARSSVNAGRAWAIDLPAAVLDGSVASLTAPVDVGPCIR